ncbi:hypothetical protein BJ912DRAFT_621791 [Pholiota molesta]|nr:hypothetical protein BJ912DRAFT_621791 [Pholiota molesta]
MEHLTKKQLKEYRRIQASKIDSAIMGELARIRLLSPEDISTSSPPLGMVLSAINIASGLDMHTASDLLDCYNKSRQLRENGEVKEVFRMFSDSLRTQKTHQAKRKLLQDLGILLKPYSALELLSMTRDERPFRIKLEKRDPIPPSVNRHTFFTDTEEPDTEYHYVGKEAGYYIVSPEESVVFYSQSPGADITLELVVIRGVAHNCSLHSELYQWLTGVVQAACNVRRNVRPTHRGSMTQVGLNLAARHVRVLGFAKSFTAKLSKGELIHHDQEAIGAASIAWGFMQATIPNEITAAVNGTLSSEGLPRLATQNIGPGSGFSFCLGNDYISLPMAERAPPEAYFTLGYESWAHVDPAYCKYAFFLCVNRSISPEEISTATNTDPKNLRSTRTRNAIAKPPVVHKPGANFVDATLRVVVEQASGTIISFQPDHLHGTSRGYGASNAIISINFSKRVGDAWADAQAAVADGKPLVYELFGQYNREGAGLDEENDDSK